MKHEWVNGNVHNKREEVDNSKTLFYKDYSLASVRPVYQLVLAKLLIYSTKLQGTICIIIISSSSSSSSSNYIQYNYKTWMNWNLYNYETKRDRQRQTDRQTDTKRTAQ